LLLTNLEAISAGELFSIVTETIAASRMIGTQGDKAAQAREADTRHRELIMQNKKNMKGAIL